MGNSTTAKRRNSVFVMLAVLLWALVSVGLLGAAPAVAAQGDRIPDYRVEMTIDEDGTVHGKETINYTFSGTGRHGIFVAYRVRQEDSRVEGKYRLYDLQIENVSSPTNAPADYDVSDDGALRIVRIGHPARTVSGTQTYVIEYTVTGTLNQIEGEAGKPDTQELSINPISPNWEAPIERATVTVKAPVGNTRSRCFVGAEGSKDESRCVVGKDGKSVTFTGRGLGNGIGMTVGIEYPDGTFTNVAPIYVEEDVATETPTEEPLSPEIINAIGAASAFGGVAAVVGAAVFMGRKYKVLGRDKRYEGLTPGVLPDEGAPVSEADATGKEPVTVRFEPPENSRPGLIGTLQDGSADMVDITATIIDLAVRGYWRIEEANTGKWLKKKDWRLVALPPRENAERLLTYEEQIWSALLGNKKEVLLSARKERMARKVPGIKTSMYRETVDQGWYSEDPDKVRRKWGKTGAIIGYVGLGLTPILWIVSSEYVYETAEYFMWSGLGLGVAIAGLIVSVVGRKFTGRTARGTAMLDQARGFKEYLTTAEAHQIRFEEAEGIFSRYLPYAIVFGCTKHWAKVFEDVQRLAQADGFQMGAPTWYMTGSQMHGWQLSSFQSGLESFSRSVNDFAKVAESSSSGSSGSSWGGSGGSSFSGGFSSGGGGFGGGGGGSW